jgi:hypothetical protein
MSSSYLLKEFQRFKKTFTHDCVWLTLSEVKWPARDKQGSCSPQFSNDIFSSQSFNTCGRLLTTHHHHSKRAAIHATMVQPTLHDYFPSTRPCGGPKNVTFLHLPFAIRRRIYLLAGLPVNTTIALNYRPAVDKDRDFRFPALDDDVYESFTAFEPLLTLNRVSATSPTKHRFRVEPLALRTLSRVHRILQCSLIGSVTLNVDLMAVAMTICGDVSGPISRTITP